LTLPLELMGTELIEMLMAQNTIVETLDVIEDFLPGFFSRFVDPLFDLRTLQVAEERIGIWRLSLQQRLNSTFEKVVC
jgi:hypothetical protein